MNLNEPGKFTLERFFAGELEDSDAHIVRGHLEKCEKCTQYVGSLKEQENAFLAEHPFSEWATANVQIQKVPWYQLLADWLFKPFLIPVYGAILIFFVVFPLVIKQPQEITATFKGQSELTFMYQRDGVVGSGSRSDFYQDGDQIQILYTYSKKHYVGLISIDVSGVISFYQPESTSSIMTVESEGGNALSFPGSIILDNSKEAELIIALISKKPLQVSDVEMWASDLFAKNNSLSEIEKVVGSTSLPHVIEARTLLLKKK